MTGSTRLRQAAATVLWRQGAAGQTEVFVVQRAAHLAAFGGFWAFPGGTVEPHDAASDVPDAVMSGGWVAAAARELFEETGILALRHAASLDTLTRQTWRAQVQQHSTAWSQTLTERGLVVDGAAFVPFGRWKTPPFSPVIFDAQYFALALPADQTPQLWPKELCAGLWLTAEAALARHECGDMLLAYPVQATLQLLAAAHGDMACAAAHAEATFETPQQRTGQMVPGVRMLPVPTWTLPPATHTNCYILGHAELVIVDPGTPHLEAQNELVAFVDGLCGRGARVREIWLTHAHPDHTGAASRLRRHYGVPLAAHADTGAYLAKQGHGPIDREIVDDTVVRLAGNFHWRALHTPGHAPGHLCFYERARRHLLCGDNVLGLGSSLVAPSPHGSMQDYMVSLKRLLTLNLDILLPGHGPPVATPYTTIKRYIAHREQRERQIYAALTTQPQTPEMLLHSIYADVQPQMRPLARISLCAHLEKLILENNAAAIDGGFTRC